MIPYHCEHTSKPVRDIFARASKCAPSNDKSAVIRAPRTHGVMRVSAHHRAVKIVRVVLSPVTRMCNIGISGAVSKGRTVFC